TIHQRKNRRALQVWRSASNRLRRLAPRKNSRTKYHRRAHASRRQRSPSLPHPCASILLRARRRTNPRSRPPQDRPTPPRRTRNRPRPEPSSHQPKHRPSPLPRHQPPPKPRRSHSGVKASLPANKPGSRPLQSESPPLRQPGNYAFSIGGGSHLPVSASAFGE